MLPNIYVKWTNFLVLFYVTVSCFVLNTRVSGTDIMITFRIKLKYFVKNSFIAN